MKNVSVYLEGNIFYRYLAWLHVHPLFVCTPTHPTIPHPVRQVFSVQFSVEGKGGEGEELGACIDHSSSIILGSSEHSKSAVVNNQSRT